MVNIIYFDLFTVIWSYTALALIFAAKTIIRQNDIKNNSLYFLAGTMVNVTYSIVIRIIINGLIENTLKKLMNSK